MPASFKTTGQKHYVNRKLHRAPSRLHTSRSAKSEVLYIARASKMDVFCFKCNATFVSIISSLNSSLQESISFRRCVRIWRSSLTSFTLLFKMYLYSASWMTYVHVFHTYSLEKNDRP